LRELGLIDGVVPEPMGGAHQNQGAAIELLREALVKHLDELGSVPLDDLPIQRYAKFRKAGEFLEG
jgi:acetyl-CoA carboxylase carboxyl transferase subunit alpha